MVVLIAIIMVSLVLEAIVLRSRWEHLHRQKDAQDYRREAEESKWFSA